MADPSFKPAYSIHQACCQTCFTRNIDLKSPQGATPRCWPTASTTSKPNQLFDQKLCCMTSLAKTGLAPTGALAPKHLPLGLQACMMSLAPVCHLRTWFEICPGFAQACPMFLTSLGQHIFFYIDKLLRAMFGREHHSCHWKAKQVHILHSSPNKVPAKPS